MTAETVTKLLEDALMRTTYPNAYVLLWANELTGLGVRRSLPQGAVRKMPDADAFLALEAVTRMMRRYGLSPTEVCEAAQVAHQAKEFYKFHLTQGEMDGEGRRGTPIKSGRRVHRGLASYVRIVRQVAARAGVLEAELLDELGKALAAFLAPYADSIGDAWDTLADDLADLARYFERVCPGSDGQPIDLPGYFTTSFGHGLLRYDPVTDRMQVRPEDPSPDDDFREAPRVPLFARTVAVGSGTCRPVDAAGEASEAKVNIIEVVHVGLVPDGRRIRTVLFAEPWTAILGRPGDGTASGWMDRPLSALVPGAPFAAPLRVVAADDDYEVCFRQDAVHFTCGNYRAHLSRFLVEADDDEIDDEMRCFCCRAANVARRIDLDPDVLREFMEGQTDAKWLTHFDLARRRGLYRSAFAIPPAVVVLGEATSDSLIDRVNAGLIGEGHVIIRALSAEATRRVRAMETFTADSRNTERARRTLYRRLTRADRR